MSDPFSIANSASADLIFLDMEDLESLAGLVGQIRSLSMLFTGRAAILADEAADALMANGEADFRRRRTAELLEQCLAAAEEAAAPPLDAGLALTDPALVEFLDRADAALAALDPRLGTPAYKRKLHSLKGDAGVVGLRDEAQCCHAMEDALARGFHPSQLVEAVDWLGDSFAARRFGLDLPPVAGVLAGLQRRPPLGETLVAAGHVHPEAVAAALAQQAHLTPGRPLGEILIDAGRITPQALAEVLGTPVHLPLRIDPDRLQALDAALAQVVRLQGRLDLPQRERLHLDRAVAMVGRARKGLHLTTARNLLERMARVAQDSARTAGVELYLDLEGTQVDLDRSLADQLADPLQHLVRNAIGHGLEPPAERERLGKPRVCLLGIRIMTRARAVVVEIADDGRGIDRAQVLTRAGLPADLPTDGQALWKLISQPGFSTASSVTAMSGRGIGLDVVADLVSQWDGDVDLASTPGLGTTFRLTFPPRPPSPFNRPCP